MLCLVFCIHSSFFMNPLFVVCYVASTSFANNLPRSTFISSFPPAIFLWRNLPHLPLRLFALLHEATDPPPQAPPYKGQARALGQRLDSLGLLARTVRGPGQGSSNDRRHATPG